jgi:hypothetical protein
MILPAQALFHTEASLTVPVTHLRQNPMDALVFLCFIPLADRMDCLRGTHALPVLFTLW